MKKIKFSSFCLLLVFLMTSLGYAQNQAPVLDPIGSKSVDEGAALSFRISATDPDLTIPTLSAVDVPTNATFVDSGNGAGSFIYNPDYTQSGTINITFIASDGSLADSEIVQITVNNINRTPVLDPIGSKSVNEGANLTFRISSTDPDGTTPTLSTVNIPPNAVFVDSGNGAGSFVFNPDYTQSGTINVTFIASDGSLADSEVVQITVNNVNLVPVLDPIGAKSINEGANLTFRISSTDPDATIPILSAVGIPTNATFVDSGNGAGSFIFNPDYTQAGTINVTFIASDGSLADSEVVQITVNNTNRTPVLDPIGSKSVNEGANLTFRISSTDPDATIPILSAVGIPTNATFVDSGNGAGSFIFNPDYTQAGTINVTFIASDGSLADSEVVQITVNNTNRSPVLDAIGAKSVDEGANLTFRISSTDPDATIPILSAVGIPTNATFVDSGNGAGSFIFNPDYTQAGTINVTFIASDGSLADSEIVQITVNNINRTPVLDPIGSKSVNEGANLTFRISSTDPDGTTPTLSTVNIPPNAVFVDSGNGTGSFVFNPDYTQATVYNVTFISSDGGLADSEVVQITVNNVNQAPILNPIGPKGVNEGANLSFKVSSTDLDGTVPTLSAVNVPTNATFVDSGNGAGSFVFNPDYIQSGIYNVTFIASDGSLADSEVVQITVNDAGNQAPVLDAIGAKSITEGLTLSFRTHATDADGTTPTLSAVNAPTNTTFVDSGNGAGSFVFNPDYTQSGIYNVTFIASDGNLADSEIVAITVIGAGNQYPVLDSIGPKVVNEGLSLSFRTHATDLDGTTPTLSAVNVPTNAIFTDSLNGAGSLVFNPSYTQSGIYNVTFIASDGSLADSEVVQITVNNVNQAPILNPIDPKGVNEGANLSFKVSSTDLDGTVPTLTALNVPTNAVFTDSLNGAGSLVFNPDYTQSGIYNVTFIASDGSLADSEIVQITVNDAGNQYPVLDLIGAKSVDEAASLSFRVHSADPDLTIPALSAVNVPTNATFMDSGDGAGSFVFNPDYAQAGIFNVTFIASDGSLADSEVVQITVNNVNRTPMLDSIGPKNVIEGFVLTFPVHSTDPDGNIPTLTAINVPANAVFVDSANGFGSLVFNPNYTQAGIYNVTVISSDGSLADSEVVQITVTEAGNQYPVLDSIGPKTVIEGFLLTFRVHAADLDMTIPTLSAVNLPTGATFVDSTNGAGSFRFIPGYTQTGIYDVTFIASDGSLADSEIVRITVTESGNQPPTLDSIRAQTVREGDTLVVLVSATNPDGPPPVLTISGNPTNSTFADSGNGHGVFRFYPNYYQAGTVTVSFFAIDNSVNPPLTAREDVIITITDVNQSPLVDSIPPQTIQVGSTLRLRVRGTDPTDPNGGALFMSASSLPLNSTFADSGGGIGGFVFTPNSSQIGVDTVYFYCTDNENPSLTGMRKVIITIVSVNHAPVLNYIGYKITKEGDTLRFAVTASDPDGTFPTFYTSSLPRNAVLVDSGNGHGLFTFTPDYAQAKLYSIIFYATDGALKDSETVFVQVQNAGNQRPVLFSIGSQSLTEGETLRVLIRAADPDSTIPHIFSDSLPLHSTFVDSGNGRAIFTFTPWYNQSGVYYSWFRASDGSLADSERVQITVVEFGNRPPFIFPIPPETLSENSTKAFNIYANDPDSTIPILRAWNLPTNAQFLDNHNGTGTFYFSPNYFQAGTYNILFEAVDVEDTTAKYTRPGTVVVLDVNQSPFMNPISGKVVNEGATLVFNVYASDPDSTIPHLFLSNPVRNMSFVDSGNGVGTFTFTPDYAQAAVYYSTFWAVDAVYPDTAERTVQIVVQNVPVRPIIYSINDTSVIEGGHLTLRIISVSPDSTIPTLTVTNIPAGAVFADSGNGRGGIFFNPSYVQSGIYNVSFIAKNTANLADTELVQITVIEAGNQLPILTAPTTARVSYNATLNLVLSAVDPDGTTPQLFASPLPINSIFTDSLNGKGLFSFSPDSTQKDSFYQVYFVASDGILADTVLCRIAVASYQKGDVNFDGIIDIGDIIYLINYTFYNGPAPVPLEMGDVNADGIVDMGDIVYLINFVFYNGPPPVFKKLILNSDGPK